VIVARVLPLALVASLGLAGCTGHCGDEARVEKLGNVVGVRATMPDNGDRPGLVLEIHIPRVPQMPCPFAVYEFDGDAQLSMNDLELVATGEPNEVSDFGGVLLETFWLGEADVWRQLTNPQDDENPYDSTFVAIVCPGLPAPEEVISFTLYAGCSLGEDGHLKDGPTLTKVDVAIDE
jgi:hypothetical protein